MRVPLHSAASGIVVCVILSVAVGCSKSGTSSPAPAAESPGAAVSASSGRAVVNGKGPSGTMVLLEPLFEHEFPAANGPAYMDQTGLAFVPELLPVKPGQSVEFRNNEDVLHNVRVQETGTYVPVFNVATTPYNSYTYTFDKPGYYDVGCDIHAAMRAMVIVSSAPYVGEADGSGRFAFSDVVPGRYMVTWFESGKPQQKQVTIQPPTTDVALP